MCFDDGFVHADLHPGNMLVTQHGELAISTPGW
jgi:predicted unusual protein kinase regulating ubiquinone biosynthesis (AarF/ABC1/UbiB family)